MYNPVEKSSIPPAPPQESPQISNNLLPLQQAFIQNLPSPALSNSTQIPMAAINTYPPFSLFQDQTPILKACTSIPQLALNNSSNPQQIFNFQQQQPFIDGLSLQQSPYLFLNNKSNSQPDQKTPFFESFPDPSTFSYAYPFQQQQQQQQVAVPAQSQFFYSLGFPQQQLVQIPKQQQQQQQSYSSQQLFQLFPQTISNSQGIMMPQMSQLLTNVPQLFQAANTNPMSGSFSLQLQPVPSYATIANFSKNEFPTISQRQANFQDQHQEIDLLAPKFNEIIHLKQTENQQIAQHPSQFSGEKILERIEEKDGQQQGKAHIHHNVSFDAISTKQQLHPHKDHLEITLQQPLGFPKNQQISNSGEESNLGKRQESPSRPRSQGVRQKASSQQGQSPNKKQNQRHLLFQQKHKTKCERRNSKSNNTDEEGEDIEIKLDEQSSPLNPSKFPLFLAEQQNYPEGLTLSSKPKETLEDAQKIMLDFWQKNEEMVYKYIDSCLDKSQYETIPEFQKSFSALNLNTFSITRSYTKKPLPESQITTQNLLAAAALESQDNSLKKPINHPNSCQVVNLSNNPNNTFSLKTEDYPASSPERSRVDSNQTQRNRANTIGSLPFKDKTLVEGSSTLLPGVRSASGSNSGVQKTSRFQNLTKLLMYKIFKIFGNGNLNFLKIEKQVLAILPGIMKRLKDIARDKTKQSDFINHSHYRALFLRLTTASLDLILSKQDSNKDILNHRELFFVDLLHCDELDLSFCNVFKRIIFNIFELYCDAEIPEGAISPAYNPDRFEYLKLAQRGIRLMQTGKVIHSFDHKQQKKEFFE